MEINDALKIISFRCRNGICIKSQTVIHIMALHGTFFTCNNRKHHIAATMMYPITSNITNKSDYRAMERFDQMKFFYGYWNERSEWVMSASQLLLRPLPPLLPSYNYYFIYCCVQPNKIFVNRIPFSFRWQKKWYYFCGRQCALSLCFFFQSWPPPHKHKLNCDHCFVQRIFFAHSHLYFNLLSCLLFPDICLPIYPFAMFYRHHFMLKESLKFRERKKNGILMQSLFKKKCFYVGKIYLSG